ncbi:MAG: alpha/beta hydrolase [Myxococcales bacterium]|nr:alpha/beta hydrolase [Myxococcales bacterium]
MIPLVGVAGLALALAGGCLTIDGFFFNGVVVDGFDFDADPPDPDLDGELTELHPSIVPPESRVEGFIELDDRRVHYVYAHRPDAAATIFFSHGNARHLGRYYDRVEILWERGFNVMIYDYPSYGLSTGEPDEPSVYENAVAVLELLPTLPDFTADRLVFYGYSLGGAPAYEVAVRGVRGEVPRPHAMISEAAFCSAETLVQDGSFRDLSGDYLLELKFDNCAKISELDEIPIFIIHGGADSFVVPRNAQMLKDRAGDNATLWIVEGAEHSYSAREGGEEYWERLTTFAAGG